MHSKSTRGLGRPRINRVGQRYGRLLVLEMSHVDKSGNACWRCLCECGTEKVVPACSLASGSTRSCGCLWRERMVKHGLSYRGGRINPTYAAWYHSRRRCNDPRDPAYRYYGGRGIEHRFDSVLDLIADIGEKPDQPPGLSIDRIDNNGHYEAGNVRWATASQQVNNRRPPEEWRGLPGPRRRSPS